MIEKHEEICKSIAKLRVFSPRLNTATDRVANVIYAIEEFLAEIGIGVSVETDSLNSIILGYGRISGRFQFYVVIRDFETDKEKQLKEISRVETPWASCDREAKLESVVHLPELLEILVSRTESLVVKAEKSTEILSKISSLK